MQSQESNDKEIVTGQVALTTSTQVITAETVQAEEVPTIPLESLETINALQPEIAIRAVTATQAVSVPVPLVVQPAEYHRSISEWLHIWWDGLRLHYLVFPLMPLLLGSVLAWTQTISARHLLGQFHLTHFFATLVLVILLQCGANLINDYYDYLRGIDKTNTFGVGGLIQQGIVRPVTLLNSGLTLLALATLGGFFLAIISTPLLLLLGLAGLLGAFFYSATRRALSSLMLGELTVFLIFGPLITLGAYAVQTRHASWSALLLGCIPGLLAAAVVYANNMRDNEGDAQALKYTFATRFNLKLSRTLYSILVLGAYVMVAILALPHGTPHFMLLAFWTLPSLFIVLSGVMRTDTPAGFHAIMRETLQLETMFISFLVIGLLLNTFGPLIVHLALHTL